MHWNGSVLDGWKYEMTKKNSLKINLTFLTVNRMNSWFLYRPGVYNVSQIIYASTTWIDGRVLDSIINKFNQMNLQNGQSEHLFIDQLSVSAFRQ